MREQLVEACERLHLLGADHEAQEAAAAQAAQSSQHRGAAGHGIPLLDDETGTRVRRCLTAAFFANAAQRQPSGEYLAVASREAVAIHPSSALFSRRANCVLFNELLYTTRLYMRDLTQIDAEWLTELAPGMYAVEQTSSAGGPRTMPGSTTRR